MNAIENAATEIGDAMYAQVPNGEVMTVSCECGVEIVLLMAGIEGRGDGSRAMWAACELADRLGVALVLTPDGGYYENEAAAEKRLRAFYARFGFVAGIGRQMIRAHA
jgi:GNAT superfamily N-acetyltransferase